MKTILVWAILIGISFSNILVTVTAIDIMLWPATSALLFNSLDTWQKWTLVPNVIVWIVTFSIMSELKVGHAVGQVKNIKSLNLRKTLSGFWLLARLTLLFWPLAVKTLYLGIKYNKSLIIATNFGKGKVRHNIRLKQANYREHSKGVTKEDIKEHFILTTNEYIFKDRESLSYLLLKYNLVTILKSFGYLHAFEDHKPLSATFGISMCPLERHVCDQLDIMPNNLKDSDVIDCLEFV